MAVVVEVKKKNSTVDLFLSRSSASVLFSILIQLIFYLAPFFFRISFSLKLPTFRFLYDFGFIVCWLPFFNVWDIWKGNQRSSIQLKYKKKKTKMHESEWASKFICPKICSIHSNICMQISLVILYNIKDENHNHTNFGF